MSDKENGLRNVPWTDPAMNPPGPGGDIGIGGYDPTTPGPQGIVSSPWDNKPVPTPSGAETPCADLGQPAPRTTTLDGLSEGASFDHDITHYKNTVDKK